jgi:hypothetical protein
VDVVFGRLNFRRMRNDSWHGGRYTEHRERREKGSLWRIGRHFLDRQLLQNITSSYYRVAWEPQHILIENTPGSMPLAKHQSNSGRRSAPVTLLTSVIESKGMFSFSCARRMASPSGAFVKQKALRPFTFT